MNIVLINPPRIRPDMPVLRDEICFQDVAYTPFPIRLAQVASVIRKAYPQSSVSIIDANALNMSLTDLEQQISAVDMAVFQSACGIIREDARVASLVKKKCPSSKVVLIETVIAPVFAKRFLTDFPDIDIIVQGQPEKVIPDIINSYDDLSGVAGISYRDKKGIVNNGAAQLITDLDSLPFMAYDLLPMEKYSISILDVPMHEKVIPGIRIRTTRDCPYGCPFCIIGTSPLRGYDKEWKAMSVKRVVDEIEHAIKEWGVWGFFFWDETYTYDRDRAYAISEEIIKRNLRLEWRCLTRIDCVDEDLLRIMYRSGCRQIEFGLESGDENVRKKLHKNFPDKKALEVIKTTRKIGIKANVDMIIGMPWESRESLDKTLRLGKKLHADNVHLTMAFPYPHTQFYDIAEKEGLLQVDDIYDLMLNHRVRIGAKAFVRTRHLSSAELERDWCKVRVQINRHAMLYKIFFEPATFIRFFISSRTVGECLILMKKAVRRFFRIMLRNTP